MPRSFAAAISIEMLREPVEAMNLNRGDNVAAQGRALAHDANHVERQEPFDERVGLVDMIIEDRDLGLFGDRRPVRDAQCDVLVVIQDCDLQWVPRLRWSGPRTRACQRCVSTSSLGPITK